MMAKELPQLPANEDDSASDISDEEYATCTVCHTILNETTFKICEHPLLHTALCICCFEKISGKLEVEVEKQEDEEEHDDEESNDRCDWCMECDCDELVLCGGEDTTCSHQFCKYCLNWNLGESYVRDVVDKCDEWTCLCCNPEPLKDLIKLREEADKHSAYSTVHVTREDLADQEENAGEDDLIIAKYLIILQQILDALEACYQKQSHENLDEVESKIRDEYRRKNVRVPSAEAKVEMETYTHELQWTIDALQLQEAECFDILQSYGVDPSKIPHYREFLHENAASTGDRSPTLAVRYEDFQFTSPQLEKRFAERNKAFSSKDPRDPRLPTETFYFEVDSLMPSDDLQFQTDKAASDEIVLKYSSEADPPELLYPQEFENVIPKSVLKALCYGERKEILRLQESYSIPNFIATVMKHVSQHYPNSSKYLQKLERHPAVLKAIYHESHRERLAELWSHYDLNPEYLAITDFGETRKIYSEFEKRRQQVGKSTETTYADYEEYVETEDKNFHEIEESLLQKCEDPQKRNILKQSIGIAQVVDEVADHEDHIRERKKALRFLHNRRPSLGGRESYPSQLDSAHAVMIAGEDLPRIQKNSNQNNLPKVSSEVSISEGVADHQSTKLVSNTSTLSKPNIAPLFTPRNKAHTEIIDLVSDDESADGVGYVDAFQRMSNSKQKQRGYASTPGLSKASKEAEKKELERLEEINRFQHFGNEDGVTLNPRRPNEEKAVLVIQTIGEKLKPHQIEGIQFLWENIAVSLDKLKKRSEEPYGCLIAHCMGLGKTLTTVAFTMTMLTNPLIMEIMDPFISDPRSIETVVMKKDKDLDHFSQSSHQLQAPLQSPLSVCSSVKRLFYRVLIVAPKNTLQNWEVEFKKWTPIDILKNINIYVMSSETTGSSNVKKLEAIKKWFEKGGILIMSYQMFRGKVADPNDENEDLKGNKDKAKDEAERQQFQRYLQNPGPDLVIADEAHMIKNKKSKVAETFQKIRTKRRIALTGSPLQNNLEEYWCMVNWVKQRALYSLREYKTRFIEPIKRGEHKGASLGEVREMKKRTHVLHTKLKNIVQRKGVEDLRDSLPSKREFVLVIKMTDYQKFLYKYFISHLTSGGKVKRFMFKAYQSLLRVFNHPLCTVMNSLVRASVPSTNIIAPTTGNSEKIVMNSVLVSTNGTASAITTLVNRKTVNKKNKKTHKFTLDELRKSILEESYPTFCRQSAAALQALERTANEIEDHAMKNGTEIEHKQRKKFKNGTKRSREGSDKKKKKKEIQAKKPKIGATNSLLDVKKERNEDKEQNHAAKWVSENFCNLVDDDDDIVAAESSDEKEEKEEDDFIDDDSNDDDDEDYEEDAHGSSGESDSEEDEDESGDEKSDDDKMDEDEMSLSSCNDVDSGVDKNDGNFQSHSDSPLSFEVLGTKKRKSSELEDNDLSSHPPKLIRANVDGRNSSGPSSFIPLTDHFEGELLHQQEEEISITRSATDTPFENKTCTPSPCLGFDDGDGIEGTFAEDDDMEEEDLLDTDWWKLRSFHSSSSATILTNPPVLSNLDLIMLSSKMTTLLSLLALSVKAKDKMIVFSQSIPTLDLIELFLQSTNWGGVIESISPQDESKLNPFFASSKSLFSDWKHKVDYLRIDGSTNNRQKVINDFNGDSKIKVILISTKAGNMGINLQAANRVVLFDCSWNPAYDLQATFRSWRLGQTRNVFVYRLISAGTMEEKIYKRQVQKQALAARVVDAQMPDNIFTAEEQAELFEFDEANMNIEAEIEKVKSVIRSGPAADTVLEKFVDTYGQQFLKSFEDNDFLLIDKENEHLNEEERKEAEDEFEREVAASKRGLIPPGNVAQPVPVAVGPTKALLLPVTINTSGSSVLNSTGNMLQSIASTILPSPAPEVNPLLDQEEINGPSTDEDSDGDDARSLVSEDDDHMMDTS